MLERALQRMRPRRRVVGGLLASAVVATLLAGGLPAPASAAQVASASAPVVRLIAGHRTATAAWSAVAGARDYSVRWSTKPSLAGAHTITTTKRTVTLTKLRDRAPLWVRVTANTSAAGVRPAASTPALRVVPSAGYPLAVSKAVAVADDDGGFVVTWRGGGRATKVGVIAGGDSGTRRLHFHSAWYPASTRSVRIKVPDAFRDELGYGAGNPVFFRIAQSNSTAARPPMSAQHDIAAAYRISTAVAWAMPRPRPADVADAADTPMDRVTVATLNMQSITASKGFSSANRWAARAPRIARTVQSVGADLLLTAELTTSKTDPSCVNHPSRLEYCELQYQDMGARLRAGAVPYATATADAYLHVYDQATRHPSVPVTDGTQIFYNPARMTPEAHGYISPTFTLGLTMPSGVADRWISWARFRLPSGQRFVAVAVHVQSGNDAASVRLRGDVFRRLAPEVARIAGPLPVVLGGDFNSDAIKGDDPGQPIMRRAGWFDSRSVAAPGGWTYSTSNRTNGTDWVDEAYPATVRPQPSPTNRIDYILLKNSPHTFGYDNVLYCGTSSPPARCSAKNASMSPAFTGSDHNLQLATVGIGVRRS